jgi:hypothetical protein
MTAEFEILSGIKDLETIAAGWGVYIRRYLEGPYGSGRLPAAAKQVLMAADD